MSRLFAFPDYFDSLYDDNAWIYNTGASNHSLHNKRSMIDMIEGPITMILVQGLAILQGIEDGIPLSKLNWFWKHKYFTCLKDISYYDINIFNLFSLNEVMSQGWESYGDYGTGYKLEEEDNRSYNVIYVGSDTCVQDCMMQWSRGE